MDGKFINHPEITWKAEPTGGFGLPPPQSTIDLKNFLLNRFIDLRTESDYVNTNPYKLRLIGDTANIYINGPDLLIDILSGILSYYKGKHWLEIENIKLKNRLSA